MPVMGIARSLLPVARRMLPVPIVVPVPPAETWPKGHRRLCINRCGVSRIRCRAVARAVATAAGVVGRDAATKPQQHTAHGNKQARSHGWAPSLQGHDAGPGCNLNAPAKRKVHIWPLCGADDAAGRQLATTRDFPRTSVLGPMHHSTDNVAGGDPAEDLSDARACSLLVTAGKRRRNSMAARNSPRDRMRHGWLRFGPG